LIALWIRLVNTSRRSSLASTTSPAMMSVSITTLRPGVCRPKVTASSRSCPKATR